MTFAVDVITLFPGAVEDYCATSVLGRAREAGVWRLRTLDPREKTNDVHRSVDDAPLGGGAAWSCAPSRSCAPCARPPTWRVP